MKQLLTLISAIILTLLLSPIGILYNLGKSIYKSSPIAFLKYWLNILYQIWIAIKFLMLQLAVVLDLIGNVTTGELIEDCVTAKEDTLYGKGGTTISAATGELEAEKKLNKTGLIFTAMLDKVFGAGHCLDAYKKEKLYPLK